MNNFRIKSGMYIRVCRGGSRISWRRAEGGAKIFGVFRVKNHDFTPKNLIFSNFRGDPPLRSMPAQHFAKLRSMSQQSSKCRKSNKYCESTYFCWHQLSQFLQNALILRFLNSWYQSITGNNQWENSILLDFYFRGLSGSQNQQKLEPHD